MWKRRKKLPITRNEGSVEAQMREHFRQIEGRTQIAIVHTPYPKAVTEKWDHLRYCSVYPRDQIFFDCLNFSPEYVTKQ